MLGLLFGVCLNKALTSHTKDATILPLSALCPAASLGWLKDWEFPIITQGWQDNFKRT
jgi:hypothetical protein